MASQQLLTQIQAKFRQLGYTGPFDGTSPMSWAKQTLNISLPQHLAQQTDQTLNTVLTTLTNGNQTPNGPPTNAINTGNAPAAGQVGGAGTSGGTAGSGYGQVSPGSYMNPTQRNNETVNPSVFGQSQTNPNATKPITASQLPQQPSANNFQQGNSLQATNGTSTINQAPAAPPTNDPTTPPHPSTNTSFMGANWNDVGANDPNTIYSNLQSSIQGQGYGSGISSTLVQQLQQNLTSYTNSQKPPTTMYY